MVIYPHTHTPSSRDALCCANAGLPFLPCLQRQHSTASPHNSTTVLLCAAVLCTRRAAIPDANHLTGRCAASYLLCCAAADPPSQVLGVWQATGVATMPQTGMDCLRALPVSLHPTCGVLQCLGQIFADSWTRMCMLVTAKSCLTCLMLNISSCATGKKLAFESMNKACFQLCIGGVRKAASTVHAWWLRQGK